MAETVIAFTLNGDAVQVSLKSADRLLVDVLREDLRLTGTKRGCGNGYCGTCAVLVNGAAVSACLQLAVLVDGAQLRTIEGLGNNNRLHPVQAAFVQKAAFQCGICTPGWVPQRAPGYRIGRSEACRRGAARACRAAPR